MIGLTRFNSITLFVCSDKAGTNSILSICSFLIKKGQIPNKDFYCISNNSKNIEKVKFPFVQIVYSLEDVKKIIGSINPKLVYTSTSFGSFEYDVRILAKKRNIKTIAFIDHWVYYLKRFNFYGSIHFPDEIHVINKQARNEGIQEGLPKHKIKIIGNPYYQYLREEYKSISDTEVQKIKQNLGIINAYPTYIFVSENIKSDIVECGHLDLGFDEYTILESLFKALNEIDHKFNLIIKIHPVSKDNKFDYILKKSFKSNMNILIVKNFSSIDLIKISNVIFGMFSNMLIEGIILGKKVIRIQINEKYDLFKYGNFKAIKDQKTLNKIIKNLI